jgi:toxin YoeB
LILIKWLSRIRSQRLAWTGEAWSDYLYWQSQDRKTLRRINALIADSLRTPFTGLGKPEVLRENLSGFWSRRIDETNRLVYAVDDDRLTVTSCRYHC